MTSPKSKNVTKRKRLNTRLLQTPTVSASSTVNESPASSEPIIPNEPSTSSESAAASKESPLIRFDDNPAFQAYLKERLSKCIEIRLKN